MSAADRMVIRMSDGTYRSVSRRAALGLISARRAKAARATEPVTEPVEDAVSVVDEHANVDDGAETGFLTGATNTHQDPDQVTPRADDAIIWDDPTLEVELPAEPRGNANREHWTRYAESLGVHVSDDMGRNQIRDAALVAAQSLDHLPQPAQEGGRLETPEDEPVTGGSVTDDEDTFTR